MRRMERLGKSLMRLEQTTLTAYELELAKSSAMAANHFKRTAKPPSWPGARACPEIGALVSLALHRNNLSPAELAKKLHCSLQYMQLLQLSFVPNSSLFYFLLTDAAGWNMPHALVIWARTQLPREYDEYRPYIGLNMAFFPAGGKYQKQPDKKHAYPEGYLEACDYIRRTYLGERVYRSKMRELEALEKTFCKGRGIPEREAAIIVPNGKWTNGKILLHQGVGLDRPSKNVESGTKPASR